MEYVWLVKSTQSLEDSSQFVFANEFDALRWITTQGGEFTCVRKKLHY